MPKNKLQSVAFVGLGLIGGSFARLIKTSLSDVVVYGIDSNASSLEAAHRVGVISQGYSDVASCPSDVDLVIVATPMASVVQNVEAALAHFSASTLVSDVASVKAPVFKAMSDQKEARFVSGHPMAGTEAVGFDASTDTLLAGATYMVIDEGSAEATMFCGWLKALGFRVLSVSAADHDALVATASHLPYVMACLAVEMAEAAPDSDMEALSMVASSGFRDTTRVAASSPAWGASVMTGNPDVLAGLDKAIVTLSRWRSYVQTGDQAALQQELALIQQLRPQIVRS